MKKNQKFKICLTMAGAVSAGAYTAGVLDYLFETLSIWSEAKKKNLNLGKDHEHYDDTIPMHDVEIDIVSGTSAGGMAASLLFLSLLRNQLKPAKRKDIETDKVKDNLLYDLWINMLDDNEDGGSTFDQMISTEDLTGDTVDSLLNSKVMEDIAAKAFDGNFSHSLPDYVAKDVDLILTVTSLEGLPFKLGFKGTSKNSSVRITTHDGFLRYRFAQKNEDHSNSKKDDFFYTLNLNHPNKGEADKYFLKQATLSTGAFPIGFKPQQNQINKKFLEKFPYFIFNKNKDTEIEVLGLPDTDPLTFTAIDGGVVNNEPFGLTKKVFENKHQNTDLINNKQYAILMIDPFPAANPKEEKYQTIKDMSVKNIGLKMFSALRNQAFFNQDGISDALDQSNQEHFLISPVRAEENMYNKKWNALACGALYGFAGFMSKSFRKHDFQLGRQNCQTALRYYFSIEKDHVQNKLDFDVNESKTAYERFMFYKKKGDETSTQMFPIIPDLKVIKAWNNQYDFQKYKQEADLGFDGEKVILPPFPQIDLNKFIGKHKKNLSTRTNMIIQKIAGKKFAFMVRGKAKKFLWEKISDELIEHELVFNTEKLTVWKRVLSFFKF